MKTSDFDYHLPQELIAQKPAEPRDHSRLMLVNKNEQTIEHRRFYNILDYFKKGDLLVYNDSKVFKARLFGQLLSKEGAALFEHKKKIEIFLVRPVKNEGVWQVLAKPGRHVRLGTRVAFAEDFYCDILIKDPDGTILAQFPCNESEVRKRANKYGRVPVPPYVKDEVHELGIYQTIYARHEGSVAAPTAGFHFTPKLFNKLKNKGVNTAGVTLHVGLGTFLPVKSERIEDHTMHSEWVRVPQNTADQINLAKKEGRRIIAVGTTTVRTLEGAALLARKHNHIIDAYDGEIDIFIKPGFKFKIVDALITNFHLPKSTLLMLVSAFAGNRKFVLRCYEEAVKKRYRFYSFGDAMFLYDK